MAIETSGKIGSVALAIDSQVIVEHSFKVELQYAGQLLPAMDNLCRQVNWRPDQIDQLYVSAGPGSFTGIRIAITVAKTLSYAKKIKVVPVPSMEALALNASLAQRRENLDIRNLAVVLEAGRGQIFSAVFENNGSGELSSRSGNEHSDFFTNYPETEQVLTTCEMLLSKTQKPLYLLGEGINYHQSELKEQDGTLIWLHKQYWLPRASFVHHCGHQRALGGHFVEADLLEPIYLRRPEAVEKWEKLHGEGT